MRVQQARGQPQGQQIAVRDAIIPAEGIFGENAGEIEVVRARVVVGEQALVTKRRGYVKRPRLQRLEKCAAKVARVTLKHQATVQTESGHHPASRQGAIGQRRVKLVIGGVQLYFGRDETGQTDPGMADLCQRINTLCVGLPGQCLGGFELGVVNVH